MRKKYVVAIMSYFNNEIRQYVIDAESNYEAVKLSMLRYWESEDGLNDEVDWQNHPDYPKTYEDLKVSLFNSDMNVSVIEI